MKDRDHEFIGVDDQNYAAPSTYKTAPLGSGETTELWHVYYLGREIKQTFTSKGAALAHLEYLVLGHRQPIWK